MASAPGSKDAADSSSRSRSRTRRRVIDLILMSQEELREAPSRDYSPAEGSAPTKTENFSASPSAFSFLPPSFFSASLFRQPPTLSGLLAPLPTAVLFNQTFPPPSHVAAGRGGGGGGGGVGRCDVLSRLFRPQKCTTVSYVVHRCGGENCLNWNNSTPSKKMCSYSNLERKEIQMKCVGYLVVYAMCFERGWDFFHQRDNPVRIMDHPTYYVTIRIFVEVRI